MGTNFLEVLKRRLDIVDDLQDQVLQDIINDTTQEFLLITGAKLVLPVFNFIITDVSLKRYNRRGNEGMKSTSIEGHSTTYESPLKDFEQYKAYLRIYYPDVGERLNVTPGEVTFY
ncbi:phage head-tail connector protein [Facklamia sp. P13069]|uniref:phage head-tail connector protein n=1 Tax=Facklamia sp. P13069 TaxID=3421954 RepID=UPI003D17FAF0